MVVLDLVDDVLPEILMSFIVPLVPISCHCIIGVGIGSETSILSILKVKLKRTLLDKSIEELCGCKVKYNDCDD